MRECPCYKHASGANEQCGRDAYEQFSLGIFAGYWCDDCFDRCSGYRKDDASGFDPMDAGEHYEEED